MAMTNTRRGVVWLAIAAACIAWLSWAWSPAAPETEAPLAQDAANVGNVAAPAPTRAVPPAPPPAPVAKITTPEPPAPAAPAPEAPEEPEQPERIPTPHLMSLDQTKPPEQWGALAELKNQFASESRSAQSGATEEKLRQLLSEARNVPGELVQGISCRRSICKLDLHWTARRRIGFAVLVESFKNLYNQRVAVAPAHERSADGTYHTTVYVRVDP